MWEHLLWVTNNIIGEPGTWIGEACTQHGGCFQALVSVAGLKFDDNICIMVLDQAQHKFCVHKIHEGLLIPCTPLSTHVRHFLYMHNIS